MTLQVRLTLTNAAPSTRLDEFFTILCLNKVLEGLSNYKFLLVFEHFILSTIDKSLNFILDSSLVVTILFSASFIERSWQRIEKLELEGEGVLSSWHVVEL